MLNNQIKVKDTIDRIPETPGVYKMLDSRGEIIYIGKSKCLKKRVKSYFVDSPKWEKARKMAPFIRDIEFIETDTHLEAMLLECQLIKEVQPFFNVQMKNDSRYVYVKIADNHCSIVHEREQNCFGPFRSKHLLQKMLDVLKSIYPIEENKGTYECEYHVLPISMKRDEAERNFNIMKEMFQNTEKMELFVKHLEQKMSEEATNYRYESAAKYRDIVQAVRYLKNGIDRYRGLVEKDLLLQIKIDRGYKLVFVSKGQVIYKRRVTDLSEQNRSIFLEEAKQKKREHTFNLNDKSYIDYRDVLYAEIEKLPEESIIILK